MKKLIPFIIIICLLLPSCQLRNPQQSYSEQTFSSAEATIQPASSEMFSATENISVTEETINETKSSITAVSVFRPNKTTNTIHATTKRITTTAKAPEIQTELRGIWISCYDHISAAGKTRTEYKTETDTMFRNIKECGLNTAFVHLRAFSDAFYESQIYPYSAYIAGKEGASLSFDPFEVILESAKKHGISVHGWINPFRVSTKNDVSLLSSSNPAKKILDSGNQEEEIAVLPNGIYYNPSCTSNHQRIIDGVREIISKYNIDGIHIDDYFYPTTDKSIDQKQYSRYQADGGSLSLTEWRTNCVNAFVSAFYSAVKTFDQSIVVSISPAAQFDKNEKEYYADCKLWLSRKGYADMIIPQIYFGFEHETLGFQSLLDNWGNLSRNSGVKLACGIAAYKCGQKDNYAGTGVAEWQKNTDILSRQTASIRNNKNYSGFVIFSYRDLLRTGCKTEIQNLKKDFN